MRRLVPGQRSFFFVGEGEIPDDGGDVMQLAVRDDYDSLSHKVDAMLKHCVGAYRFDWLFKCDDDTYLAPERLVELTRSGSEMVGFIWENEHRSVSGGAGYIMSRRVAAMLAAERPPRAAFEDVEYTLIARRLGIEIAHDPRLQVGLGEPPGPGNARISSHWCSPEELRAIDSGWEARP